MNNSLHILPATENDKLCLLAEVSPDGISFLYYQPSNFSVVGLLMYQFEKDITEKQVLVNIEKILPGLPGINGHLSSVHLCFNNKEAILIPEKFFNKEMASELLSLQFGLAENEFVGYEKTNHLPAYLAYPSQHTVQALWNQYFPGSGFSHSTALQVEDEKEDVVQCIINQQSFKIFAYNNGQLAFTKQYAYSTPTDVVYHLLNVYRLSGLMPEQTPLTINGMIEEQSALYQEIYRYFMHVSLGTVKDYTCSSEISQYPLHYFNHLVKLAKCVS